MDGRIKTLHPKIHGGILCRRDNPADMAAIAEQSIVPFELVVVNLYPFQQTVAKPNVTIEEAIENIDIGGPTLVRAAAKNHAFVTIACQPSQYGRILEQLESTGTTTSELRRELAGAAFAHTMHYDAAIAAYFISLASSTVRSTEYSVPSAEYPENIDMSLRLVGTLRYGENPHQTAALYTSPARRCSLTANARCRGLEAQQPVWSRLSRNAWRSDTSRMGRRSIERFRFGARFQRAGRCRGCEFSGRARSIRGSHRRTGFHTRGI
jgi:phosphoribosylaminoimidazolecarboxamide formyltransferase/IMP cyclohydrolase